ncbi:MAG: ribosomal protein S18-alanine N-acetyltransferase [Mogibacterium sp.]|nr:ribosomal protein S18-alanine N-acetyltransferase [Mogibacterium sp.]
MKTLSIRPAKIYDVPALARIERESFAHPWSAEQITRDIVANDRAFVAVAVLDGEPVGYADMWIVAGEAQLYNIAVAPEYRGAGIGSILMKYMAKTAARAGCRTMTLEVRRSNEPAISMYRKGGFRDSGIRKGYYADNKEDAVLMDREISPDEAIEGTGDLEVDIETV